ncbi:MAG: sigma-70 family RNA polymerase sigma factor [Planctomycetes bacterium]|nr:sigma-70 family RNA polymerase sigma factor [Planctomycetota bacterium]
MSTPTEITEFLKQARLGDAAGAEKLYEIVYQELHALAGVRMRKEHEHRTLQPTALVHETFIKLVGSPGGFENRQHFFGAASRAMRQILVERARGRLASKRGGSRERVGVVDLESTKDECVDDLITLDEALGRFEQIEPRKARVVELRFFCGLELEEVARILDISKRTVILDWNFARAWLYRELSKT